MANLDCLSWLEHSYQKCVMEIELVRAGDGSINDYVDGYSCYKIGWSVYIAELKTPRTLRLVLAVIAGPAAQASGFLASPRSSKSCPQLLHTLHCLQRFIMGQRHSS